jgi:hypothetical protein
MHISGTLGGGGGGGPATQIVVTRAYLAGAAAGDAVYQNGASQVVQADASAYGTGRAMGFILTLDSPALGLAQVLLAGDLGGFVGLTPGATYILSEAPGQIVREDDTGNPDYPVGAGSVLQVVGIALSSTVLLVDLTQFLIVQ